MSDFLNSMNQGKVLSAGTKCRAHLWVFVPDKLVGHTRVAHLLQFHRPLPFLPRVACGSHPRFILSNAGKHAEVPRPEASKQRLNLQSPESTLKWPWVGVRGGTTGGLCSIRSIAGMSCKVLLYTLSQTLRYVAHWWFSELEPLSAHSPMLLWNIAPNLDISTGMRC